MNSSTKISSATAQIEEFASSKKTKLLAWLVMLLIAIVSSIAIVYNHGNHSVHDKGLESHRTKRTRRRLPSLRNLFRWKKNKTKKRNVVEQVHGFKNWSIIEVGGSTVPLADLFEKQDFVVSFNDNTVYRRVEGEFKPWVYEQGHKKGSQIIQMPFTEVHKTQSGKPYLEVVDSKMNIFILKLPNIDVVNEWFQVIFNAINAGTTPEGTIPKDQTTHRSEMQSMIAAAAACPSSENQDLVHDEKEGSKQDDEFVTAWKQWLNGKVIEGDLPLDSSENRIDFLKAFHKVLRNGKYKVSGDSPSDRSGALKSLSNEEVNEQVAAHMSQALDLAHQTLDAKFMKFLVADIADLARALYGNEHEFFKHNLWSDLNMWVGLYEVFYEQAMDTMAMGNSQTSFENYLNMMVSNIYVNNKMMMIQVLKTKKSMDPDGVLDSKELDNALVKFLKTKTLDRIDVTKEWKDLYKKHMKFALANKGTSNVMISFNDYIECRLDNLIQEKNTMMAAMFAAMAQ